MGARTERSGDVTVLLLDRPERRNAVDLATLEELGAALDSAAGDGTRVLVLGAVGPHFCSGADLAGVEGDVFGAALGRVLDGLRSEAFVSIAAVDGFCLGAGTQLAVSCDLRVATWAARFGIPAAKLGLAVDHETVRRLTAFAGEGTARAMLLAAETVTGDDAHRLGLVQRIGTLSDSEAWAREIAALAPLTVTAHKLAIERLAPRPDDADVDAARRRAWESADLQEGLAAFRERRPPRFRGE